MSTSVTKEGQALLDALTTWDPASVRLIGCLLGGLNLTPIGVLLSLRAARADDGALVLLVAGLLLTAAGGYLGWAAWTQLRADEEAPASLPPRTKGNPWTYRRDWRPDLMTTEVADVNRLHVGMSAVWSFFAWLMVLAEWSGPFSGGDVAMLIVPAMANFGLYLATKERIRDVRFGRTSLRLETKPAVMGQRATAVFKTGFRPETFDAEGFTVRLACYHRYVTYRRDSDGDQRRVVVRDVKWSDDKNVRPRVGRDGFLEIPVSFQVPTGYPEATPRQKEDRIGWELTASADVPGINYEAAFEIPVFTAETVGEDNLPETEDAPDAAAARDDAFADQVLWTMDDEDAGPVHAEEEETSPDPYANYEIVPHFDAPVSKGITMGRTSTGGLRFDFAARRSWMGILLFGFFALFTTVLSIAMIAGKAILMGAFVGLFALVSILGLGHSLTNSSTLIVDRGRIRLLSRRFGMEKEQAVPAQQLADARPVAEGHAGKTTYYSIYLYLADPTILPELRKARAAGESTAQFLQKTRLTGDDPDLQKRISDQIEETASRLRVADSIGDKDEAEWMCAQIIDAAEKETQFA